MKSPAAKGHTSKHAGSGKHAGSKKHTPSKAQKAAEKKWQQAGAAARHAATVARHAGHAKPSKWTPNDTVACCAAEALAASLRLTGRRVTDRDVLDLYWRTADYPDAGATIEATIRAAAEYGLAGVRPVDARLALDLASGVILGLELAERHAVTLDGCGVWTWGAWRPVSHGFLAACDEAWVVTWS
jgi:hypothetical protein